MVSRPGPQSSTSSISSANLSTHSTFDHHGRLQWVIKSLEKCYQAVWTWLDHLPTWERCWAKGINKGQRPGHAAVIGRGRDRAEVKMILVGQVSMIPPPSLGLHIPWFPIPILCSTQSGEATTDIQDGCKNRLQVLVPLLLVLCAQTAHTNFASDTTTQVGFEIDLILV